MKRILKAIDKEITNLLVSEAHERYDGNTAEADRLLLKLADLQDIRIKVKEMEL